MKESKYYRAIPTCIEALHPNENDELVPHERSVEKVKHLHDNYYTPVYEFKTYWSDFLEVLCFSKHPGGAVIGACSGSKEFNKGHYTIYSTSKTPDQDLSLASSGDFPVIEEVRYTRPVPVEKVGEFTITDTLVEEIKEAYGLTFPSKDEFLNAHANATEHDYERAKLRWESEGGIVNDIKLKNLRNQITEKIKQDK